MAMDESAEIPWLREQVDEELQGLFLEDEESVQRSVQRVLERLPFSAALESRLLEALQIALEDRNDDTRGSLWIALILGEAGVERAAPLLIRALAEADEEEMQEVAGLALLRLGASAVEALVDRLEEDDAAFELSRVGYGVLAKVRCLDDEGLTLRTLGFLRGRLDLDRGRERGLELQEASALALARLGDQSARPLIEAAQTGTFAKANPVFQDAIELLEEYGDRVPANGGEIPGAADYEWIFAFAPGRSRSRGEQRAAAAEELEDADLHRLFGGMGWDSTRAGTEPDPPEAEEEP